MTKTKTRTNMMMKMANQWDLVEKGGGVGGRRTNTADCKLDTTLITFIIIIMIIVIIIVIINVIIIIFINIIIIPIADLSLSRWRWKWQWQSQMTKMIWWWYFLKWRLCRLGADTAWRNHSSVFLQRSFGFSWFPFCQQCCFIGFTLL